MAEYNIKISELNGVLPNPPFTEDFFPLVHSASMTTYRATLQDIGSLMTRSIYSDTASFALNVPKTASYSDSASFSWFAISASYALSASHARRADSASYYPPQTVQISASWASRSIQSWYSTRSLDVDTRGYVLNVPIWEGNTPGLGNGNLRSYSPLSIIPDELNTLSGYRYVYGPVIIDSGSTLTNNGSTPAPPNSTYPLTEIPNYTLEKYNHSANKVLADWGPGGISTFWPITSQTFNGTDQRFFYYATASNLYQTNSFFSGSVGNASSGSWYTIPMGPGAISSSFNNKWFRIAARGQSTLVGAYPQVTKHGPMGDIFSPYYDLGSIIRVQCTTGVGTVPGIGDKTNINQIFHLFVMVGVWATQPVVQVFAVNNYNGQLIKAGRVHHSVAGTDPWWAVDFYIDGLANADDVLNIHLQSWHGARFLSTPNWGPWPLSDTGSNDSRAANYLIFPIAPGHYDATSAAGNSVYNIHGSRVNINPFYNEITRSGYAGYPITSHALHTSGTINTNEGYYCAEHKGLTTKVTYGTNNLYFSGGILIDKFPPDTYVPPPVGTACGGTANYNGGNAMPNEQLWTLGSNTGVVTVHFFTYDMPDRLQVVYDSNIVMDTGYRGNTINQAALNLALAGYSSASATIVGDSHCTASFFKNSATTTATVKVFGPGSSTAWRYWMSCPGGTI